MTPGGDARQHRLDERAAGIELLVGRHQRAGLLLQPAGHPVERRAERRDFIVGRGRSIGHAGGQVAFLDPPGGIDQLLDRPKQPVGELQRA